MPIILETSSGQFLTLCWALFLLYWLVMAFAVKRTVVRQTFPQMLFFGMQTVAGYILITQSGRLPFPLPFLLLPQSFTANLIADFITLVGLVVLIWSRTILGRNWSANVVLKKDHELIRTGPYAYARHPIYTGLLLMVFGATVFSGRLGAFLGFLIVFIAFWLRSRQEEQLLTTVFPQQYDQYRKNVKALIPFVW